MSDNLIERISSALASESTLEGLVRQLLVMLELVTNMESTYLTRIDSNASLQHILFSRNTRSMIIPEGLSVPWGDTLCKRALDENRMFTCDVSGIWGDSDAAKALGIHTYLSTPVVLADGSLYGTLCAASAESHLLSDKSEQMLKLFAQLIAQQIRNDQLMMALQTANTALIASNYTDDLTELPNRRAVFEHLPVLFSRCQSEHRHVLIAFIDLDGFKEINDGYGHDAGDAFLTWIAQRLRDVAQNDHVFGRIGGDEFMVAAAGPLMGEDCDSALSAMQRCLATALAGEYLLGNGLLHYAGPSIGVVAVDPARETPDGAMRLADAAMYQQKRLRKAQFASSVVPG